MPGSTSQGVAETAQRVGEPRSGQCSGQSRETSPSLGATKVYAERDGDVAAAINLCRGSTKKTRKNATSASPKDVPGSREERTNDDGDGESVIAA